MKLKRIGIMTLAMIMLSLFPISLLFAGGEQEQGKEEAVTLRVWSRRAEMENTVNLFNQRMREEGRNVQAVFEVVPWGQAAEQLMAAMIAGRAPDVYSIDIARLGYFAKQGAFIDITEKAEALPFFDQFPKGMLEIGTIDEKVYAVPANVDLSGMIYNKDLFEKAGLDPEKPPETWDDVLEYGKAISDLGDDIYGYHVAPYTGFWYLPYLWSSGAEFATRDNEVRFDHPGTVEFVQFWVDAVNQGIAPSSSLHWTSSNWYSLFVSNRIGMIHGGNFNIPTFYEDAPDLNYGVTFVPRNPKGEQRYAYSGGNLIGITKQTKNPEIAWEFIEFFLDEDVLYESFISKNMLPARLDLMNHPHFEENFPIMKEFEPLLEYAKVPQSVYYREFTGIAETYITKAVLGEMTAEEAVKAAAEEMRKVVESGEL